MRETKTSKVFEKIHFKTLKLNKANFKKNCKGVGDKDYLLENVMMRKWRS